MKIYTRTGDKGQTSLYGGKRVLKSDLRIEAYGSIDELNCALGVVLAETNNKEIKQILKNIQPDLFLIGSLLAGYKVKTNPISLKITKLEKWIDGFDEKLPELKNFILPQGIKTGSLLHLARSVCRRLERRVVELSQKESVDKEIIIYLNRLSDLLFVMARVVNKKAGKKETIWKINT